MSLLRNLLLTAAAFFMICCYQQGVHADPLVLSFSNPVQSGAPGQTVTFSASIFNGNPTAVTLSLPTTLRFVFNAPIPQGAAIPNLDTTPYNANFFNLTVSAGGTLGPLPIFTLTLNANAPIGAVFTGTFCINCGIGDGGDYLTNAAPFTLMVGPPTAPVPEPATIVLFGTGLTGVVGVARRSRRYWSAD